MSSTRVALLLLSALCLSACAMSPQGAAVGRYSAGGADRSPALASLPAAAGRVVAMRRIPYANGFGQEIVLDGPLAMSGENRITAEALTTAGMGLRESGVAELKLGPPTDTEIAAEMDRALPGVAMHLAPEPEQGEEGAIGYATGTTGRLSCVYAWQYIAPARPLSLLEGAAGTGALPVSVRVRLCREEPARALVEVLRGLRVSRPDGSSEPVAVRARPGGDALAAAVGSQLPAARRNGVEIGSTTDADSAEGVRPTRRRIHRFVAIYPRAVARRPSVPRRAAIRRVREPSAELTGVPWVPMPDASTKAAPPRVSPASTGRAATVDLGMPMPR